MDRVQFNGNLIKIFTDEYERARSETGGGKLEPRNVANWKFRELDRDRSDSLQKSEYRGLRRLIKKVSCDRGIKVFYELLCIEYRSS